MTRFDVQQGHHGFFGKKSRDDKNLFEQNSYLTKKIHSNFHTMHIYTCGDYMGFAGEKVKNILQLLKYISAVGLHIYENTSVFFSS